MVWYEGTGTSTRRYYHADERGSVVATSDGSGVMTNINTLLATYAYDDRGRRTSLTRGNGLVTGYTYDAVDRTTQIAHDFSGSTYDLTLGDSYDPAGGITSHTSSNDNFAWTGHYAINRGYTANGLNQYSAVGAITPTYDSRGNYRLGTEAPA